MNEQINTISNNDTFETYLKLYVENINSFEFIKILLKKFTENINGKTNNNNKKIICEKLKNCQSDILIKNFIKSWDNYLIENVDKTIIYCLLIKLLMYVRLTNDFEINNKNEITNYIWKIEAFKNVINLFPKFFRGIDYETNGIFHIYLPKNTKEYSLQKYGYNLLIEQSFKSIELFIDDEKYNDILINYIENIINLYYKEYYTNNKYIFSSEYKILIFKILSKMMNKNLDDIKYLKIFTTLLKSIPMAHIDIYKNVIELKSSLINKNTFIFTSLEKIKKSVEKLLIFLDNGTELYVQNIYLKFFTMADKFNDEEIYNNYIDYIKCITILPVNSKTMVIKEELLINLIDMMGNNNGHINIHTRYNACILIIEILYKKGILFIKLYDKLFNNLLKYICEVNFFDWSQPNIALIDYENILSILLNIINASQNIDYDIESNKFLSKCLYFLFKKSLEFFEHSNKILNGIKNMKMLNGYDMIHVYNYINMIVYTINIYTNIYEKNIITTIFPEVENEYVILINELLTAINNTNHNLYNILLRPDIVNDLLYCIIESINIHIKICDEYLINIKDVIIETINNFELNIDSNHTLKILSIKKNEIDYPQEFLDPLINTVILHPIKIPGNNSIFDSTSIITHIHNSEQNPYTREILTLKILNEYNKKEDIIKDIEEFKNKKNKFEEDYIAKL
jgi:hypothetical protein